MQRPLDLTAAPPRLPVALFALRDWIRALRSARKARLDLARLNGRLLRDIAFTETDVAATEG